MTIPASLAGLLTVFDRCFTAPSYRTFTGLVTGFLAQTRRRTVCGMLTGAGLERVWHHARAHRLFAGARWCADAVGLPLADRVRQLLGGRGDRGGPAVLFPVCLPVLARPWRPRRTGKIAFAREMVELLAAAHPDRMVHAVGDAAYVGEHRRSLASGITWTSRLKVTSVLHDLAPPRTGKSGRPRTKGTRLGTATDLTAAAVWRTTCVRRYDRADSVQIAEITCLW